MTTSNPIEKGERYSYTIVIVTYNRLELLKECLKQVERQTVAAQAVVIIDNASGDGTKEYLDRKRESNSFYQIYHCAENLGGAGGFSLGIKKAMEETKAEEILVIDDDVMLSPAYMEMLLQKKAKHPEYQALAGSVMVERDGEMIVDTFHRRYLQTRGLYAKNYPEEQYKQDTFACDIASFCGIMLDRGLIEQIGYPHAEYFIWHDDLEYCLRMQKYTKILVVPGAQLFHKTKNYDYGYPRKYDWREYYAVRNRLLYLKEHGNLLDRCINRVDMWVNIEFRNWLFGLVKKGGYDWKYEQMLVKRAKRDARCGNLENPRIMREHI